MIHVGVRVGPLINYAAISYKLAQYYLFRSFARFDNVLCTLYICPSSRR